MKLFVLLARVLLGGLFIGHGTQKLFGWFGGHGLEGTSGFFEKLGLRPGRRAAMAAGASETAGGTLLALGLLTPVAQALITGTMVQAIRSVHWPKGIWATNGGWEYNALIIASTFAITDVGPGDWSLDRALGLRLSGPTWALAALAAGAIGPSLVVPPQPEEPEEPATPSEHDGHRSPSRFERVAAAV